MIRIQRGDRDVFEKIVHTYKRDITNLAYRYLRDRTLAEDVSQEVFLRVYRARDSYNPSMKFSSWLFRIAQNFCISESRARIREKVVSYDTAIAPEGGRCLQILVDEKTERPGKILEQKELDETIRAILDRLPEKQRAAVLLNSYEELSYNEVADAMALSLQAVKSLLWRARNNIKDRLAPYLRSANYPGNGKRGPLKTLSLVCRPVGP
jgi:RNA polymerase sigma-70 factor (ECF subfamily)